jgi:hypothetical protein
MSLRDFLFFNFKIKITSFGVQDQFDGKINKIQ